MSMMGFKKKSLDGGVCGWGELYPIFWGFLEFFNFAKPGFVNCFVNFLGLEKFSKLCLEAVDGRKIVLDFVGHYYIMGYSSVV